MFRVSMKKTWVTKVSGLGNYIQISVVHCAKEHRKKNMSGQNDV